MLNYAGEYCNARQAAVTVIRSSDAALKSCVERLTMSYVIGECLLDFQCSFADRTDMEKPANVLSHNVAWRQICIVLPVI